MRFAEYRKLVHADGYRYFGRMGFGTFCRGLFNQGFKYTFWMRTCAYLHGSAIGRWTIYPLAWMLQQHYSLRCGIVISHRTQVGGGLRMGHCGSIVVNAYAVIGKNCDLSHDVTIGVIPRGPKRGTPQIGDNVYIGPGAKILGNVRIGDHAAIGANCVVTKDVPDYGVVVGVPGRVISLNGSKEYVTNTEYEQSAACHADTTKR
ncbi:MAG: serine acetyltransferase [Planctomycetaceae bacterium]|nr:serine acetyltransferase [Planctomycetaceae bacterium]